MPHKTFINIHYLHDLANEAASELMQGAGPAHRRRQPDSTYQRRISTSATVVSFGVLTCGRIKVTDR